MTILPFNRSDFTWGAAGLPGTGLTAGEKTDILDRLSDLEGNTPPVVSSDLSDVDTAGATSGDLWQYNGSQWVPYTPQPITVVNTAGVVIDGGGSAIPLNAKVDLPVMPFSGTITGVAVQPDQSGSIVLGFWKDALANYPPTIADSVFTVTLSSQIKFPASGTWDIVNYPFSAGDVWRINVNTGATSITRVTIALRFEREVGP